MLLGKWLEQMAPSPLLPQPTQEQETLEESSISNTLTTMLPKVRVRGLLYPCPLLLLMGTTGTMVLGMG